VLDALTRPILTPIRRVIPAVNGLDLSVLVAMILLQMVNIAFVSYMETSLHAAF
jgi:YggT family protein